MAITHTAAARNDIADAVAALANGGSGSTALKIYTSGDTELVSIDIPDFTVSGAVATSAANTNDGTAGATGTASYGAIEDGDGTEVFRGACGVGSGEVQINTLSIAEDDVVTLTANITYTAPS